MHKRHDEDTDTHIVMPALQAGSPTYERGDGSLFCVPTLVRMREGCDGGGKGPLLSEDSSLTLGQANDQTLFASAGVRRLTPVECERLQGFPDGWTDVNGLSDSHRYRQMGNAVAVPCATWIGRRLLAGREP
jgi:DNA (cytosine-5)-methyltransferase 1